MLKTLAGIRFALVWGLLSLTGTLQISLPSRAQQPRQSQDSLPKGGKALTPALDLPGKPEASTTVRDALFRADHAVANSADLPPVLPQGRRVIGLALEGGGALGLAHIGVLQWLEENHIPVDRMSGTSMGALVGSMYAAGMSPAEIASVALGQNFQEIFAIESPYDSLNFRRRQDRREMPQALTFGLKGGPSLRNAVLIDRGLNEFLDEHLAAYNLVDLRYDSLPIPFRCVATDLTEMQSVVFFGGPLPQAVRASISIPGVFAPVEVRGKYLVDGAIMDNLPTDIVRKDLHADIVIGVHLKTPAFKSHDLSSIVGVFARAYSAGTARNERLGKEGADVLIEAETQLFSVSAYDQAKQLVAAGYAAASAHAQELRRYQLDDRDWGVYLLDRASRVRRAPSAFQVTRVEGSSAGARALVDRELVPLRSKPVEAGSVSRALGAVQASGTVQTNYQWMQPGVQDSVNHTQVVGPASGIEVRLSDTKNGPPFLLFGADITAVSSNVTRTTFNMRLLNTDLGGFGSELRTDVRLGFMTQVSTEYHRPLAAKGLYIQPTVGILRQPVYLWRRQQRISEHLQEQAGGGLDVGWTFSRFAQGSAEYRAQALRWHPVSGQDGTPVVDGVAQTAVLHLTLDNSSESSFSITGKRFDLKAGALFNSASSKNAPLVETRVAKAFRLDKHNALFFSGRADSFFRRTVAEPLRFSVGGPLQLSAASVDEFRGTDIYLLRSGFVHRLATLPVGYGEGLYVGFAYEGAKIGAPESPWLLRQDGVVTLVGVTPIGALTFGASMGDTGHKKVFFTYGRLF